MKRLEKLNTILKSKYTNYIFVLLLVLVCSFIFYFRYRGAFLYPNFYGEDGSVYTINIYLNGLLEATLTPFNGYLIVGQYLVIYLGMFTNLIFAGGEFSHLAFHYALASCLFLGATVSLPYILFRKELGNLTALLAVIFTAFVPLKVFDYAVIGNIGNLKFAFVYIAFLLIMYRNLHHKEKKVFAIDAMLIVCLLTNVTTAFLLPFALLPYIKSVNLKSIKKNKSLLKSAFLISSLVTLAAAFIYIVSVYLAGIPKLANYLDTPYQIGATLNILNRVTIFAFTYPITSTLNGFLTCTILAILGYCVYKYFREDLWVVLFGLWAIFIGTALFVINRPGISDFYLGYEHKGGPDQFFYFANLIFIFLFFWVLRKKIQYSKFKTKILIVIIAGLYLVWAIPYGSSWERIHPGYSKQGTLLNNVNRGCAANNEEVTLPIYPSPEWKMTVPKSIACD